MQGTIVCGVTDTDEGRQALATAVELTERVAVGDAPSLLAQVAAEEAADVIVVGARPRGPLRRGLESRLADELETETPVPVLIAPPRTRHPRRPAASPGGRR
jgi:nucleotide-binding universal stress UspA family protein